MKVMPPAMATWILKHLVMGDRNEALEGDLLEEFQRRRSASWYWRQVLGAILDLSNVLRAGLVTVLAVVFAGVWVYGLSLVVALTAHSSPQMVTGYWIPYHQPGWLAVGIVFYLAVPLSVFLALGRKLSLRAFTVGLGAGVIVIVALPFFQTHLATPVNYFLEYARTKHWSVMLWLRCYQVLQGSIPLVAAMWAARLSAIKMRTLDS
jgi:hypothetical protein